MYEHIDEFLSQSTTAGPADDAEMLGGLLTDDFCVGPPESVLPRPAWLDRCRQGLADEQFGLQEIQIRLYGDVGVVAARNNARGSYRGQPLPEALRATVVLASESQAVQLVAVHVNFVAGTRGPPPAPAPSDAAKSSAASNAQENER